MEFPSFFSFFFGGGGGAVGCKSVPAISHSCLLPPRLFRFTVEPEESYTSRVGSNLSLPCSVAGRRGLVQWTRWNDDGDDDDDDTDGDDGDDDDDIGDGDELLVKTGISGMILVSVKPSACMLHFHAIR